MGSFWPVLAFTGLRYPALWSVLARSGPQWGLILYWMGTFLYYRVQFCTGWAHFFTTGFNSVLDGDISLLQGLILYWMGTILYYRVYFCTG